MKVLQAEREQSKAESDSAIERLRADMERYHTDMERLRTDMERHRTDMERHRTDILKDIKSTSETAVTRIMIAIGIGVAFLSGMVGFLGFLLNGNI